MRQHLPSLWRALRAQIVLEASNGECSVDLLRLTSCFASLFWRSVGVLQFTPEHHNVNDIKRTIKKQNHEEERLGNTMEKENDQEEK